MGRSGRILEPIAEDEAKHGAPAIRLRQLLRSLSHPVQELAYRVERLPDLRGLGVKAGDGQRGLIGMLGLPRHSLQQQRAAGGRFRVPVGNRQPRIEAPPVVDQAVDPRQNLAALEVVGGEKRRVVSSSLCKQIFLCLLFLFTKPSVGSALPTEEQNGSGLLSSSATSPTFSRRCAAPNTTTSWPILHSETNRAF